MLERFFAKEVKNEFPQTVTIWIETKRRPLLWRKQNWRECKRHLGGEIPLRRAAEVLIFATVVKILAG
ncbi:MAG: hypothetical protein PHC69_00255 [Ruminiclostridium sp.]|nr:hypothetical protein [Ruminiclostridium sp.]